MADQWNAGNPALTNQIANDIPDINENTHWLKDIIQMLAGWKTSDILTVGPGCVTQRAKFTYVDGNTLTIGPGGYFHDGTTRQWVFWDANITFEAFRPGSGGSNASNAAASASAWHYIYLDDSAIVTNSSPELVANCFLNSTTAPTWSATAHGWYTGADRCIFAVLRDGSNNIREFWHDGGDYVEWADTITDANSIDTDTNWTDATLSIPGFSTKAQVTFHGDFVDGSSAYYARVNGQSGTTGHYLVSVYSTAIFDTNSIVIHTDSTQKIETKKSASNGNTLTIFTDGWFLPVGM